MSYQRGTIKKITIEIEYPDGSTKTSDVPDVASVGQLVFYDEPLAAESAALFNVSEDDWKQNPAMIIEPQARGGGGIPFCTHNGCK